MAGQHRPTQEQQGVVDINAENEIQTTDDEDEEIIVVSPTESVVFDGDIEAPDNVTPTSAASNSNQEFEMEQGPVDPLKAMSSPTWEQQLGVTEKFLKACREGRFIESSPPPPRVVERNAFLKRPYLNSILCAPNPWRRSPFKFPIPRTVFPNPGFRPTTYIPTNQENELNFFPSNSFSRRRIPRPSIRHFTPSIQADILYEWSKFKKYRKDLEKDSRIEERRYLADILDKLETDFRQRTIDEIFPYNRYPADTQQEPDPYQPGPSSRPLPIPCPNSTYSYSTNTLPSCNPSNHSFNFQGSNTIPYQIPRFSENQAHNPPMISINIDPNVGSSPWFPGFQTQPPILPWAQMFRTQNGNQFCFVCHQLGHVSYVCPYGPLNRPSVIMLRCTSCGNYSCPGGLPNHTPNCSYYYTHYH